MIDFSIDNIIENPDDPRAVIGKEYWFFKTSMEVFKFKIGDTHRIPKGVLDGKGNPFKLSLNDGNSRMFWMKGIDDGFSYIMEVDDVS